jgi:hypothetical protein
MHLVLQDAAWITATQSLKCTNTFDIYLLLKSSDFVNHDLSHAYDECVDGQHYEPDQNYELVLRKWYDLHPSMEYRCFVRNREIIGKQKSPTQKAGCTTETPLL